MKILLAADVQHNGRFYGHFRDRISEHITLLQYAIENRQDEAILLLLDTDFVTNLRGVHVLAKVTRYYDEPSSRIVTATIEAMVRRSNRLRSLAITHLSHRELDRLCISHKDEPIRILDAYAAPTANALRKVGVKIPEALGWLGAAVYNDWYCLSPELADRLWSYGFRDTNVYDGRGCTPLHQACLRGKLDMVCWFMSHGGDPTTVIRGHSLNAFHRLSHGLKYQIEVAGDFMIDNMVRPYGDALTRIAGVCGASCRDDCRCACSPEGCTPISILIRAATLTWYKKQNLFLSWCQFVELSPDAIGTCCHEFARVETFERLGITHVCCKIGYVTVSDPMPQDTIREIQDEESEMIDQLESWMILYEEERAKFEGSAIQFLGKWSDMLKDELDVPAPFEEYWRQQCVKYKGTRTPDYLAKASRMEHGYEVMDED